MSLNFLPYSVIIYWANFVHILLDLGDFYILVASSLKVSLLNVNKFNVPAIIIVQYNNLN